MTVYTSITMLLVLFLVYVEGTSAQANSTVGDSSNVTMATTAGVTQIMSSDMRSSASPSTADMTTDMRSTALPSTLDTTTPHMRSTAVPSTVRADTTTVSMTTDAMETTTIVAIKANTTAAPADLDPEELANQKIGNIMALSLAIPLNTFTAITLAVFIVGKRRKRLAVHKGDDQLKLEAEDSKVGGGLDNRGFPLEEKNGKAYVTSSVGNSDQLAVESTKL